MIIFTFLGSLKCSDALDGFLQADGDEGINLVLLRVAKPADIGEPLEAFREVDRTFVGASG
jgi:hypothetical protein